MVAMKSLTTWFFVLVAVGVGFLIWFNNRPKPVDVGRLMRDARRAQRRGDSEKAGQLAAAVLKVDPANSDARMVAADASTRAEQLDDAIEHYAHVSTDHPDYVKAMWAQGDLLLFRKRAEEAEAALRAALKLDASIPRANMKLALLLAAEGRRWESLSFLLKRIRSGQLQPEPNSTRPVPLDLLYAVSLGDVVDADVADGFIKTRPEFMFPYLSRVRRLLQNDERSEAEALLRKIISAEGSLEAHAVLGELLAGRQAEFSDWLAALPSDADSHPGVWLAKGLQARELGQTTAAVHCFVQAVLLDPDHAKANHQLAQALGHAGEKRLAKLISDRAEQLVNLKELLDSVRSAPRDVERMAEMSRRLEHLGRIWEAAEWAKVVAILEPNPASTQRARLLISRARATKLTASRTPVANQPARLIDLNRFPPPDWSTLGDRDRHSSRSLGSPSVATIRFADATEAVGLDFRYFNAGDPKTAGRQMFEYTGGGIGVLDIDLDGWPDMYFTQGREWPDDGSATKWHNRLFRSLGRGSGYAEVAIASGTDDRGFGQGVSVGDFDADGFPDLYVANIGRNRLLRNNGDGTFSDVTTRIDDQTGIWTTSCLVADLNGDGLPDLYDVNYLMGDDVFEKMCPGLGRSSETFRACNPAWFEGEPDQAYVNWGDGTFRRVTDGWNLTAANTKGLGIVAADLDGNGMLDVFVANDGVANACFLNHSKDSGTPQFEECAMTLGVGFDDDGRPQGCMGIAADDADHDGRPDLFVTNFYDESNTLYLQRSEGLFADRTRPSGLREPGFKQLGFGTQFLDADLDGWPDLLVTNGHIDDFSFEGKPHEMPPHCYRNVGVRFELLPAKQLGAFFEGKYLGRSLTRLDFDRDGREDFVIGHLDAPSRLIRNTTERAGQSVSVKLIGSRDRDATGAVVSVRVGDEVVSRTLFAGDGYHSSNEKTRCSGRRFCHGFCARDSQMAGR